MKKYITIAALLTAGSTLANAETIALDPAQTAAVAIVTLNVGEFSNISDTSFDGSDEVFSLVRFNGDWSAGVGYLEILNNGSSTTNKTGLYMGWKYDKQDGTVPGTSTNVDLGMGSIFTSSTDWSNISAISIAFAFITGDGSSTATAYTAMSIAYKNNSAIATYSGSSTDYLKFSGSGAFSVNSVETTGTYVDSCKVVSGSYSLEQVEAFSVAAIPEPSAFGLLAGLGALALVGTRRRRR